MSAPVAEGMSHGGEDDVALVMRTLAGDRTAFETLVQRYEASTRKTCTLILTIAVAQMVAETPPRLAIGSDSGAALGLHDDGRKVTQIVDGGGDIEIKGH